MICERCKYAHEGCPDINNFASCVSSEKVYSNGEIIGCQNYTEACPTLQFTIDSGDTISAHSHSVTDGLDPTEMIHPEDNRQPIGAKPAYIAAGDRIDDLARAIIRYAHFGGDAPNSIRRWAKEIVLQCDLIDTMKKVNIDDRGGDG